jgi:hypothetical protein
MDDPLELRIAALVARFGYERVVAAAERAKPPRVESQLEHRIVAQHVGVVTVRKPAAIITGWNRMITAERCAILSGVRGSSRQTAKQSASPSRCSNLVQRQQAAFRRQPAAGKAGDDRLVVNW